MTPNPKKKSPKLKNAGPKPKQKRPKVQLDPYTAELHQIVSKSEIAPDDVLRMNWLIDEKKAQMNSIGQDGKTLLEKAVCHNSSTLLQLLLSKGANINQRNGQLETPLHIATQLKNANMIESILAAHPDLNAQNSKGETALLIAVQQNDTHAVSTLLANKADPNIAAKGGMTPMTEFQDAQIAKELLQNGAKVNVATDQGKDPLAQAETLKDPQLVDIVLEARLKEEKHISDQNADVQHKEETIEKSTTMAKAANGPVDIKLKEEQDQKQTETSTVQQSTSTAKPQEAKPEQTSGQQKGPTEKAARIREQESKYSANERLSMAISTLSKNSNSSENTMAPKKREGKSNAPALAKYKQGRQNAA